jgi:hypothetical protein
MILIPSGLIASGNITTVGDGGSAPTVNIGAPSPTPTTGTTTAWTITYSGTVTAYNLVNAEVSTRLTGTLAGSINVTNGTTDTATVTFTKSSGTGWVYITILAGACQNGGLDNIQSGESTGAEFTSGGK